MQKEFGGELPVDVDHSDATGTGPLAGFGADFDVSLTMRDVILVRRGTKVKPARRGRPLRDAIRAERGRDRDSG